MTSIDNQKLMDYVSGKLPAEEQHEVEKNTLTDDFEADALEGLQDISNKTQIAGLVEQLNQELKKQTDKKKKRVHKREAKVEPWQLVAIMLVLLIAVLSYFIIRKMMAE